MPNTAGQDDETEREYDEGYNRVLAFAAYNPSHPIVGRTGKKNEFSTLVSCCTTDN